MLLVCLSVWKKTWSVGKICGAVPLTRSVLKSKQVRHEVIYNEDGTVKSTRIQRH